MAEGYTKLFSGIVMSTVWSYDSDTKVVWVTMLALADECGVVIGTVPGLAKMAGVSLDATRKALGMFLAPDPDSGSKEFDGRRIEEIDRGWALLNHAKYRALRSREQKLEADRVRMAERRAQEKATISNVSHSVANSREESQMSPIASASASASSDSSSSGILEAPPERAIPVLPSMAPEVWHANDWYRKFCKAWTERYGVTHGGGEQTAKAIRELGDLLAELPAHEREQSQSESPAMFARYLDGGSPTCRDRKHPFAWFVSDFSALRVRAGPPAMPAKLKARADAGKEFLEQQAKEKYNENRRRAEIRSDVCGAGGGVRSAIIAGATQGLLGSAGRRDA